MSIIEKLRSLKGSNGYRSDEKCYEIEDILEPYKPKGYSVKKVHKEFEEGSRWSNYITSIFEVNENNAKAYFEFTCEVPATECQEGMDLSYSLREVFPKEVTVIQYVGKKEDE